MCLYGGTLRECMGITIWCLRQSDSSNNGVLDARPEEYIYISSWWGFNSIFPPNSTISYTVRFHHSQSPSQSISTASAMLLFSSSEASGKGGFWSFLAQAIFTTSTTPASPMALLSAARNAPRPSIPSISKQDLLDVEHQAKKAARVAARFEGGCRSLVAVGEDTPWIKMQELCDAVTQITHGKANECVRQMCGEQFMDIPYDKQELEDKRKLWLDKIVACNMLENRLDDYVVATLNIAATFGQEKAPEFWEEIRLERFEDSLKECEDVIGDRLMSRLIQQKGMKLKETETVRTSL